MHGENSSDNKSASDSRPSLSIPTISLFPELNSAPKKRKISHGGEVKAAAVPLYSRERGSQGAPSSLGEVLGVENITRGMIRALLVQPGGAHLFLTGLATLATEISGIDDIRRGAALLQVDVVKGLLHIACGGVTFKLWFLTLGGSAAMAGALAGFRAFMPLTKCLGD